MAGGKGQRKPCSSQASPLTELERMRSHFVEYKQKNRRNAEKAVLRLLEQQPTPLLRYCRAKMLFLQLHENQDKLSENDKLQVLSIISELLQPNFEQEAKKSLLSCSLLAVVLREQARIKRTFTDDPDPFQEVNELFEYVFTKHKAGSNWLDPLDEYLDVKSTQAFDIVSGEDEIVRKVNQLKFLKRVQRDIEEDQRMRAASSGAMPGLVTF